LLTFKKKKKKRLKFAQKNWGWFDPSPWFRIDKLIWSVRKIPDDLGFLSVSWQLHILPTNENLKSQISPVTWDGQGQIRRVRSVSVFPTHPRWLVLLSGRSRIDGQIYHCRECHNIPYIMLFACHPKILHKHCLQFLPGVKMAPRETEKKTSKIKADNWETVRFPVVRDFPNIQIPAFKKVA